PRSRGGLGSSAMEPSTTTLPLRGDPSCPVVPRGGSYGWLEVGLRLVSRRPTGDLGRLRWAADVRRKGMTTKKVHGAVMGAVLDALGLACGTAPTGDSGT